MIIWLPLLLAACLVRVAGWLVNVALKMWAAGR